MLKVIPKEELFASYPSTPDGEAIRTALQREIDNRSACVAVLDDDPTGIQTVHSVNVYLSYTAEDIDRAVASERLFFLQTNSRGLLPDQAAALDRSITEKLLTAGRKHGREVYIISRGDSTLRGHYPLETQIIREVTEAETRIPVDAEILIPCFFEAGRFTCDDIHYVEEHGRLVPAAQTEFANDTTFHFEHSDLKAYVREKTGNPEAVVHSIPLSLIRNGDIDRIEAILTEAVGFSKIIVNALCYEDLEVFCLALCRAQRKGKRFLFRTAASFVRVFGGIAPKSLLSHKDFSVLSQKTSLRGLVVVGSHIKKSSLQLAQLWKVNGTVPVELSVTKLVSENYEEEFDAKRRLVSSIFESGKTPVLFTSREVIRSEDNSDQANLLVSTTISTRFSEFVGSLPFTPDFLIAKGGITSSDMATKAVHIRKATVLGQILPGIPVIRADSEARWPGLIYVIFPGNVGSESALAEALTTLCPTLAEE
ncbi:MAG: hydroxyacid dehydrogenase [Ruminococcaceae bacterium]|nr:hydroxyacid dehydrogenase [Oscillospiraceae bacterium]